MHNGTMESGDSRVNRPTRRGVLKLAGAGGLAGISGLSGCLSSLGGDGSGPVRLGTAFPYTGPYSEEANTQKEGVELAVNEINDNGGLMGRDVEIIDRDTELSGDVSARRVQDLIQNEDIDLLCANLSGGISLQTNTQAQDSDIPYMAGCQTIPDLHAKGFLYECTYTPYCLTVQSQRANARYIYDNLGTSMYGLYADYAWGQDSWKHQSESFEDLGGTISGSVTHPLGGSDFSSQMSEIQGSDAEVLFIHNLGADQATAINQAREFGLHENMEIFIGVTTITVARRAGLDKWEDIHAGIQYSPAADNSATQEFSQKMQDEYGNPGDSYSAVCYTGVKEFERAINNAESLEPSDITEAINSNPGYQHTKTQEEWRDCDNQSIQDWYIVEGKPPSEQEDEWDIFSVQGSRGGTEIIASCDDPMYSEQ